MSGVGPGPPNGGGLPFPHANQQFDQLMFSLAAANSLANAGFNPAFMPPFVPPLTGDGLVGGGLPLAPMLLNPNLMQPPPHHINIPTHSPTNNNNTQAGLKHTLAQTNNVPVDEQPAKRQKLDMPPLQTASGASPPAAAAGLNDSNANQPTPSPVPANSTSTNNDKLPSTDPASSPSSAPHAAATGASSAPSVPAAAVAGAASAGRVESSLGSTPLDPDTVDQAITVSRAHLAKLAAWTENEQEEVRFLRSILGPEPNKSYLDFARPYTTSFATLDQSTPLPSFTQAPPPPQATSGSRLARAAGAQHAQLSINAATDVVGPSIEELESKRDALANQIKLFQSNSGRKLDKSLEPPRNKTHWDYLLAEMEWMAADFQRERKWKNNLAKKISRGVLNHHKKEVGREFKQLKDEVLQRRKRAAWVSREIKKFWSNIGKLVKHKHQTIVEEEKKKQMDRHLEILVDQTETFSSKLAVDLVSKGVSNKPLVASMAVVSNEDVSTPPTQANATPNANADASPQGDDESGSTDGIDVGKVDDILQSLKGPNTADARRSTRVAKPNASAHAAAAASSASSTAAADDANDGDFGEDESEEDEEGTMSEEEEAEAAEEGGARKDNAKAEVSQLEAEAEMSIEELRHLYGARDDEEEEEEAEEEEEEDEEMAESGEASESVSASPSASPALSESASGDAAADDDGEDGDDNGDDDGDDDDDGDAAGVDDENEQTNTTVLLEKAGAVTEEQRMTVASNLAATAQPAGFTLKDQKVKTKIPFLIKGPAPLREYQHIGLDWLVSMYDNGLNGILADEMGLGKTLQCIALLAHLACEKGIWGQHLIVVPTSVIVNWEMEFKRWLPGFKVLCYHGTANERKIKRRGWNDTNAFHVCITSYQLVLQDARIFKRKKYHCLILDEAHQIKNFKSQRWQTLLNFRTHRRLLLTGTPLQNSVLELWSLMHFLMPNIFQSQAEFKTWFSNPVSNMVEGKDAMDQKLLNRLHGILRPFLLRRLKTNVAQQLPQKFEHVLSCKMSKRQRILYEDFMAASDTQRTLASGNFMSMMNVVMSLRKVCNHPDLFSGRAIVSPFDQLEPLTVHLPSRILNLTQTSDDERVFAGHSTLDLDARRMLLIAHQVKMSTQWNARRVASLATPHAIIESVTKDDLGPDPFDDPKCPIDPIAMPYVNHLRAQRLAWRVSRRAHISALNAIRCAAESQFALYDPFVLDFVRLPSRISADAYEPREFATGSADPVRLVTSYAARADDYEERIKRVCCIIPKARAKPPTPYVNRPNRARVAAAELRRHELLTALSPTTDIFRTSFARQQIFFPDKYLLQWDCGKLQRLALLLRERKAGGHRVLIFTQFSRMLDILESFLSMHGYMYLRLDGSTKVDDRGRLMERFNRDTKYFVFILSTRSGGIGINLVGADTCVMYDTDWNPAADMQAQDRAHRLGQTREVNIFRLITERSIEENILKKSNQKREMNNVVIGDGNFTTDMLEKLDPRELLGLEPIEKTQTATVEEVKDGADGDVKVKVKAEPEESLESQIQRQQAEMASLEDEVDRAALEGALAETQADLDDFAAGDGDKSKSRAAAAVPASGRGGASIKSMGKVGALRGKPSTATGAVAAFENALTPVQRYALHFSEFIDPLITAQQMRATQKQMQLEEAKWNAKQGITQPIHANAATGGDAMDTSDDAKSISVKVEPGGASSSLPAVKKEPIDSATAGSSSSSSLHPPSIPPSHSSSSSPPLSPSSSTPLPSSSSSSSPSYSKNVFAGSRLEEKYFLDLFKHDHPTFYQQIQSLQQIPDLQIAYEYPFQQPEYQWQMQQQQQAVLHQQQQQAAAVAAFQAANPGATPPTQPTIVPPPTHSIPFGTLPTNALANHYYFNSLQRKGWQSRAYRSVLRAMANRGFRELTPGAPLRDAPPSPTSDDHASSSDTDSDGEYGLFATPDSISRMLGPRLHHPERVKALSAKTRPDVKAPLPHRRRIVGTDGDVRIAYVSSDNSDPVSIRIPWLKLKAGGIDRSFLVLSRAGVDYPAKTNTRIMAQQGQQHLTQNTVEEQIRANKMRIAYDGLKIDTPTPVQMRHVSATALLLPTPKRPVLATKPLPAAAASASAAAPQPVVPPSQDATPKRREGLFAVRPSPGAIRPRPMTIDEAVPRDRLLNWSPDEDQILQSCVNEYGTNWQLIAQVLQTTPRLAGRLRSSKEVMNRYAFILHKRAGGADIPLPPPKPTTAQPPTAQANVAPANVTTAAPAPTADADEKESKKRTKDGKVKDKSGAPKTGDKKDAGGSSAPPATPAGGASVKTKQKAPGGVIGFGSKQLIGYVDRATKQMKQEQMAARAHLRTSFHLPPTEDPNQKPSINLPLHASHKTVILEAHNKLGLPPQAVGKTLMPHQIIQLRMRRQQEKGGQRHPGQGGPHPMQGARGNYPQGGNMQPNSNQPMQMTGGGPNMAQPSNQRMSSTPNMNTGSSGNMPNRSGSNMPGGGGPQYSGQQRPAGSGSQMPNQPGNYPNTGGATGGQYPNSGNYNSSQNPQQNYSNQSGGYNQPAGANYSGGNNNGAPPMQRYQSTPNTGTNTSQSGSRGTGNQPINQNYSGNVPYNQNSSSGRTGGGGGGGGNYSGSSGNPNYNSSQSGGSSNYYPSTSSGNYNPSVSPPPGAPNTSGGPQSNSNRAKSPASANMNYTGGQQSGSNFGGGMNVMMNSSGAPTPNIPPANTNYYPSGSPGGNMGGPTSNNANFNNFGSTGGGGGGGGGGSNPSNYTGLGGTNSYPSSSRGSSGGSYNNSTPTSNYTPKSTTGPDSIDESQLTQLLTWVNGHMPMLSKSAVEIYSQKALTPKQRFEFITGLISKGSM